MGVMCMICTNLFSCQSNLNKHMKTVHKVEDKNLTSYELNKYSSKCHECNCSYRYVTDLREHLKKKHQLDFETETMSFKCMQDFEAWFDKHCLEHSVQYIRRTGSRTDRDTDTVVRYDCSRSYVPQSKQNKLRLAKHKENPIRASKSRGSSKIDGACTSQIKLKIMKNGEIQATYYKTHFNHDLELQHLRICQKDRSTIAEKLLQGVTVTKILEQNRDNIIEGKLRRIDLLTRDDVKNVKYAYGIKTCEGKINENDALAIDMWVQEQENIENSAILYYKKQGEKSDILKEEDFCLIIMNSFQKLMLEKFGENVICIDSTHGLNKYDFKLTTVMVIDEFGEGFPTAYMFTNRQNISINKVFFNKIKEKIGYSVVPTTFMSDITSVFYNAWKSIMGNPLHQLYCAWHIDRAWRKNLTKIRDKKKRKRVYKTLKFLQNTASVVQFEKCLLNRINIYIKDPDTYEFGNYFLNNYSKNYMLWAACYRQRRGTITNRHLESMHKTIKYYYLKSKSVQGFDKNLHALLNYTRDKIIDMVIKNTDDTHTAHADIYNRHSEAISTNNDTLTMETMSGDSFLVHNNGRKYEVTRTNGDNTVCCQIICRFCNICVHTYKCTCPDHFLNSTICKHVHFLVMNKDISDSPKNVTNEGETQSNLSAIGEDCIGYISSSENKETEIQAHLETFASNNSTENINEIKTKIENELPSFLKRLKESNDPIVVREVYSSIQKLQRLLQIDQSAAEPVPLSKEPPNKKIKCHQEKNERKKTMTKPSQGKRKIASDMFIRVQHDHLYF